MSLVDVTLAPGVDTRRAAAPRRRDRGRAPSTRSDGRSPTPPRARSASCRRPSCSSAAKGSASRASSRATPCSSGGRRCSPPPGIELPHGLAGALEHAQAVGRTCDRRGLGRRGPRGPRDLRYRQAHERRGDLAAARARAASAAVTGDSRQTADLGRAGGRHRRGHRRRHARGEGCGDPAAAGRGPRGRDGRRRRERRARARAGRSRARDRYGHRRRDRGIRHHARHRRPARRRRCDPALAAHARDDQGQPLLGLRLQRPGAAARGARLPRPDHRGCDDGALERLRRLELPAPARLPRGARS